MDSTQPLPICKISLALVEIDPTYYPGGGEGLEIEIYAEPQEGLDSPLDHYSFLLHRKQIPPFISGLQKILPKMNEANDPVVVEIEDIDGDCSDNLSGE